MRSDKCVWTAQACTDCIWAHPQEASKRPKFEKNSCVSQVPVFLHQKYENVSKVTSQRCPNGWLYFRGGASCGTLGAQFYFLAETCIQSAPKVTPRWQNWFQKWCQNIQSARGLREALAMKYSRNESHPERYTIFSDRHLNHGMHGVLLAKGPADCAKRLQ